MGLSVSERRNRALPFAGNTGSDSYQFMVDFERDTRLKKNVNIHVDMGAYNTAHNEEKAAR